MLTMHKLEDEKQEKEERRQRDRGVVSSFLFRCSVNTFSLVCKNLHGTDFECSTRATPLLLCENAERTTSRTSHQQKHGIILLKARNLDG